MDVDYQLHYCVIGTNEGVEDTLGEAPVGAPDENGNLIGGTTHGAIDPRLSAPISDGGRTMIQSPLASSPAINMGDPTSVPGFDDVPEFDQRGTPYLRVAHGRIDIGAVEYQLRPPQLPGDFNRDGVVDTADYILWRQTLGSIVEPYAGADGSGNGIVGPEDNAVWRSHFGNTLPPANGTSLPAEPVNRQALPIGVAVPTITMSPGPEVIAQMPVIDPFGEGAPVFTLVSDRQEPAEPRRNSTVAPRPTNTAPQISDAALLASVTESPFGLQSKSQNFGAGTAHEKISASTVQSCADDLWNVLTDDAQLVKSLTCARRDKAFLDNCQNPIGHLLFRPGNFGNHLAGRRDDFDIVIRRADGFGPFEIMRSQNLRSSLASAAETVVFRFQREADNPATAFFRAERGNDVVGFDEMQIDRLAGLGDFVRLDAHRPVVARGGGADEAVACFELACRRRPSYLRSKRPARRVAAGGYSTSTGPLTMTTSCPRASAASASAFPMRPLEAFVR